MKQKLLAALEQRYGGAIGSKNEIYEKVVTAYGNLITSEEQIPDIVAGVEPLLKTFQSVNDKLRAFENKQKPEPTPQPSDNGNNPPKPKPETPDFKAMLADALAEVVNPLKEELAALKGEKASEVAVKTAREQFFADEWVNGYPELRDAAWQQAIDVYEDTERKYTAEQLHEKAMKYFKPLAKAKGLDISKPFQSDGGAGGEAKADFSGLAERLREKGLLPNENKN